jgi:streptogramin lyase
MNARVTAGLLTAALLAGCAGGTGGVPPAGLSNAHGTSDAVAQRKHRRAHGYARFIIPQRKRHGRKPHFVSAATQSASIVAASATSGSVTTVADLSAASSYCTGGGNARTCTVPVSVPFGDDTITITTYDQAPSGGQIPPNADELGIGSATQTVVNGSTPAIVVFLSGLIASLGFTPAFASLPADGSQSTAMFVIDPRDFGNKKINAGTSDPYANPITATLTETGAAVSHAQLLKNGVATGSSAVLKYSSDTIALQYDGMGKPGYTTTVKLTASGVSAETAEVAPLYVTSAAIRSHILGLNGTISNPVLAISETDAPASTAYTVTQSGCTSIATPSSVSGTGPSATFNVAGGTAASATGCSISVADSNSPSSPLTLPTTNTPIAGSLTIGGVTLTDYGVGQNTNELTLGPDGNFWFTGQPSSTVGLINPSSQTLVTSFTVIGQATPSPAPANLAGITTGPDGGVWATDQVNGGVDRITPGSYIVANYPLSGYTPLGIGAASDGTMYVGGLLAATPTFVNVAVGGLFATLPVSPSGAARHVVQGPDGAIWFAETANFIARYDPISTNLTEINVGIGTTRDLCVGNDGNIWFTENGSSPYVGQIVPNGTGPYPAPTQFSVAGGALLSGIACGADNAIWYLDANNNDVGRISLKAGNAQTTYNIPTANAQPVSIKVGPDGSLWYTESNAPNIGQILP